MSRLQGIVPAPANRSKEQTRDSRLEHVLAVDSQSSSYSSSTGGGFQQTWAWNNWVSKRKQTTSTPSHHTQNELDVGRGSTSKSFQKTTQETATWGEQRFLRTNEAPGIEEKVDKLNIKIKNFRLSNDSIKKMIGREQSN